MKKFLLWAIAGFVALVVAPQLLAGGGSAVGVGLGILLLFFIVPAIARALIGTMLGSIVGAAVLLGIVALLLGNPRGCSSTSLPVGDPGTLTEVARIAYLAESDYDRCLATHINSEAASNQRLNAAARACQASADLEVTRCMARVGEHWWNFDKAGSCRDEVSRTSWRSCATSALRANSDNDGNVAFGACEGMSVNTGLLRRIAGLFSGQSDQSGGQPAPATTPTGTYDLNCLVTNYNANIEAISALIWQGKLPKEGCGQYMGQDQALQQCAIEGLSALGPGGVSVVASCAQ